MIDPRQSPASPSTDSIEVPPDFAPIEVEHQIDARRVIQQTWPEASEETVARLAEAASIIRSEPGRIMSEDEIPPRVTLMVEGTLAVIWNSPDGRRAFAGLIGPREFFGLSTLAGADFPADIDALTQVTLITWVSGEFRDIAVSDRQLTIQLLDRSVDGIQRAIYMLKVRMFTTAGSRLAGLLLRFEAYCFGANPLVSRGQLGDLAAVSFRMVSSIIRRWEAEGIVRRMGASGLELLDREALSAKAAPFNEFLPPSPPAPGDRIAPSLAMRRTEGLRPG